MSKRKFTGLLLILLLVCSTSVYFINTGFRHVLPQSMARYAGQNWHEGQYAKAIRWYANANISAYNAGLRWTAARYYIEKMKDFLNDGELNKALETCSQAVKILDAHDDEGAVSYNCTVIEEKIKRQK